MDLEEFMKFTEADVDPEAPQVSIELTVRPELYLNAEFTVWSTLRYEPQESETGERPITIPWSAAEAVESLLLLQQTQNGYEEVKIGKKEPKGSRSIDQVLHTPTTNASPTLSLLIPQRIPRQPPPANASDGVEERNIEMTYSPAASQSQTEESKVIHGNAEEKEGENTNPSLVQSPDSSIADILDSYGSPTRSQADGAPLIQVRQYTSPNGAPKQESSLPQTTIYPFIPLEITSTLPSHYLSGHVIPGATYVLLYPGCSLSIPTPANSSGTSTGSSQEPDPVLNLNEPINPDLEMQNKSIVIPGECTVEFTVRADLASLVVEEPGEMLKGFSPVDMASPLTPSGEGDKRRRLARSNTVPSFRMSFHE